MRRDAAAVRGVDPAFRATLEQGLLLGGTREDSDADAGSMTVQMLTQILTLIFAADAVL
jgi:hypothetical protein